MFFLETLLIGLSLATDAFAAAVAIGATLRQRFRMPQMLTAACFFGGFQLLMPIAGWWCGSLFRTMLEVCGGWVAFFMLNFVGIKMIHEAIKNRGKAEVGDLCLYRLTTLALATSIDAFAVGISFACLLRPIIPAAILIGCITFIVTLAGCFFGRLFGHIFENRVEIAGGIILMLLGAKMLISP